VVCPKKRFLNQFAIHLSKQLTANEAPQTILSTLLNYFLFKLNAIFSYLEGKTSQVDGYMSSACVLFCQQKLNKTGFVELAMNKDSKTLI